MVANETDHVAPAVIRMEDLLRVEPSDLKPRTPEEELEAMSSPDRWPMRPPSVEVAALPLINIDRSNRKPGEPAPLATLLYRNGVFYLLNKNVFAVTTEDARSGGEVTTPAVLFEAGWRGD